MSYQFAGFFAKPGVPMPPVLPSRAVWRVIETPFVGIGIRYPAWLGKSPAVAEVQRVAGELGLDAAEDWLYITYDAWGGVDYVYGLGRRGTESFGPVEESSYARTESVYLALMEAFGIGEEDALRFAPFERGFWGEV